jgi:ACS family hexuronate transporter-like MFS transporter
MMKYVSGMAGAALSGRFGKALFCGKFAWDWQGLSAHLKPRPPAAPPIGRYRWRILALLFFATTINYVDRSVLGVLAPTLQYRVFHWTDQDYASINIAFKTAYAIGLLVMGTVIDRIGARAGYTLSVAVWSLFGMMHALVRPAFSLLGFCVARFGLGLGEAGNFPAAIKAVAEWFPQSERALATGILNAGTNVGAVIAPLMIPLIVLPDGTHWQYAFLVTGVFSFVWIILWLKTYRAPGSHARLTAAEFDHIHGDSPGTKPGVRIPLRRLLGVRETWAFTLAKVTDAAWWFYLFWGGKFLYDRFGLDIKGLALPLIVIYVVADAGSVGGGWLSSSLIRRGWSVNRARKTALLVSALFVLPVVLVTRITTRFNADPAFYSRLQTARYAAEREESVAGRTRAERVLEPIPKDAQDALRSLSGSSFGSAREFTAAAAGALTPAMEGLMEPSLIESARSDRYYWIAVILMACAAAGHQAWSANLFTVVSDVFPKAATASLIGFGGMFGAGSGLVADWCLGRVLSASGPSGYAFAFLIAGSLYLLSFGVLQILMPRMTPLDENLQHRPPSAP